MIYVFIVDTSASMNRLLPGNLTFLETAKAGIEQFFKHEHLANPNRANNRYMLVTYEEPYYKTLLDTDDCQALLRELKTLRATDLSIPGPTFTATFEYLDMYRKRNNFDTIGRGRYIAKSETTLIFWFTDGSYFTVKKEDKWVLTDKLDIFGLKTPGHELYREPFRWDQRLYLFWITHHPVGNEDMLKFCEIMGGQWMQIPSVPYMLQCIDNCVRPTPHPNVFPVSPICHHEGVIVQIAESPVTSKWTPTPQEPLPTTQRMLVYANRSSSQHFPIPEAYWVPGVQPDTTNQGLSIPPRLAQPVIYFTKRDDIYLIPEGFPVDRFSVDQNHPAVRELMQQRPKISWTLYIQDSDTVPGMGHPFGTLKYSESSRTVSMYIMPYRFPELFTAIISYRKRRSDAAKQAMIDYLQNVPIYYLEPLKRAFAQINLLDLWPSQLNPTVNSHIERYYLNVIERAKAVASAVQQSIRQAHAAKEQAGRPKLDTSHLPNVYDIPQEKLLETMYEFNRVFFAAERANAPGSLQHRLSQEEEDLRHTIPISQMGNYAPRMAQQQRLRDPFADEEEVKQREKHIFGNPFRVSKKGAAVDEAVDEADEEASQLGDATYDPSNASDTSSTSSASRRRRPRVRFPGRKPFRRNRVPSLSPAPAPVLIIPPIGRWKEVKERRLDIAHIRRKAEEEYIQKRKKKEDTPRSLSPPFTVKVEAEEKNGNCMHEMQVEIIDDSDEGEMHISPPEIEDVMDVDAETDPNAHMPHINGEDLIDEGAIKAESSITRHPSLDTLGTPPVTVTDAITRVDEDRISLRQGMAGDSSRRGTQSPEPEGAYDAQVHQQWGRWDSFKDVRRRVHSLIWRTPRDYNQQRLLKTLDAITSTSHLTPHEKRRVLEHAIRAATSFRRPTVTTHAQNLLETGGLPTAFTDMWENVSEVSDQETETERTEGNAPNHPGHQPNGVSKKRKLAPNGHR